MTEKALEAVQSDVGQIFGENKTKKGLDKCAKYGGPREARPPG